jgi:hypothetical protein
MWRRVAWQKFTDFSEELTTSNFSVEGSMFLARLSQAFTIAHGVTLLQFLRRKCL